MNAKIIFDSAKSFNHFLMKQFRKE